MMAIPSKELMLDYYQSIKRQNKQCSLKNLSHVQHSVNQQQHEK